jgi:spermidine synthase
MGPTERSHGATLHTASYIEWSIERRCVALGIAVVTTLAAMIVGLIAINASKRDLDRSPENETMLLERQSDYNTLLVSETHTGLRILRFERGGEWQTAVRLDDPGHLAIGYTQAFPIAFVYATQPQRVLMVGLGGGAFPRFLRSRFSHLSIDIVEIDPAVVEIAKSHFGFREDAHMRAFVADGRRFIESHTGEYDVVFLDAYGIDNVPYHLATREFLQRVRNALTPSGVVVSNLWDPNSNPLYASMVQTYRVVFPEVTIMRVPDDDNRLVIAHTQRSGLQRSEVLARAHTVSRELALRNNLARMVATGMRPVTASIKAATILEDANAPRP